MSNNICKELKFKVNNFDETKIIILDKDTRKKHSLCHVKPIFSGQPEVWAVAVSVTSLQVNPLYVFFNRGINDFYILRYRNEQAGWERIALMDISQGHLYGLLWKWSANRNLLIDDSLSDRDKATYEIVVTPANVPHNGVVYSEQSLKEMGNDYKFYFPGFTCEYMYFNEKQKALKAVIKK